jgi:hypothetical protein
LTALFTSAVRLFDAALAMAGSVDEFPDYSTAIIDPMVHANFSPKTEGWSIITATGVSHFDPARANRAMIRRLDELRETLRSMPQ